MKMEDVTALDRVQCYRRLIKLEFRPVGVQPGFSSGSSGGNERLLVLRQRPGELLWVWWADGQLLLSAVSDLGRQGRVLLANGLVVLQDPLQVGHRLVRIFTLNLQRGGKE